MNVSNFQKKIINTSKKITKENYNFSTSTSYFPIFAETPGTLYLKSQTEKKYLFNYLFTKIKFFISILFSEVRFKKYEISNNYYENIFISWGFKNNFDQKGNFIDKYTNKNISNYKKTLIFLIYLDEEFPKKVKSNTILVYRKKNFKNFNLIFFLKYILKNINSQLLKKMSSFNSLSEQVKEFFDENISYKYLKKVFFVYEGQPYQKNIINYLRKKNKKINTTGYDHSAPPALPLNLIYDNCSPDKLLVTGKAQRQFYCKYLNWPKDKIKIIPSFRFKNEKKNFFKKKIFLPFELSDKENFAKNFHKLVSLKKINNLDNFEVKIHPLGLKIKKHIKFANKIKSIIKKNYSPITSKHDTSDTSVFFGQTTAIVVALEKKYKCYHVCSYPIFDCYSPKLWNCLKVEKITNYLYSYELKERNSFMTQGKKYEKIF